MPYELERDAKVTAAFGLGIVGIGGIASVWNTKLSKRSWKWFAIISSTLTVGYIAYYFTVITAYVVYLSVFSFSLFR
jgi:hypothetical protein